MIDHPSIICHELALWFFTYSELFLLGYINWIILTIIWKFGHMFRDHKFQVIELEI